VVGNLSLSLSLFYVPIERDATTKAVVIINKSKKQHYESCSESDREKFGKKINNFFSYSFVCFYAIIEKWFLKI